MKPFMRPVDRGRLAPVGWVAEPAGLWGGKQVEVVYDPRRHQLVRTDSDIGDRTRVALGTAGFRRVASAGEQELWVRDRVEAARSALDSTQARHRPQRVAGLAR
ncbi:hypothetical protein PO878_17220 [Iamia majanohamensis]|uniref:Uncharacterized protein n=1 Tax=Iamia majanohamensis TaxID=467976 RepID=A0AAE9Y445_9ACTN|nr:hypothetical protein [Iamia majanohamensis]WCO66245.1 hypothetical protein PO878_17220 [Iamia majanohamensis]